MPLLLKKYIKCSACCLLYHPFLQQTLVIARSSPTLEMNNQDENTLTNDQAVLNIVGTIVKGTFQVYGKCFLNSRLLNNAFHSRLSVSLLLAIHPRIHPLPYRSSHWKMRLLDSQSSITRRINLSDVCLGLSINTTKYVNIRFTVDNLDFKKTH